MTSSSKNRTYRLPNFGMDGAVPKELMRPGWIPPHSTILPSTPAPRPWPAPPSPPPGPNPFPDPPQKRKFHEVDPPEQNPYNDPDYDPNFLVTDNFSRQAGDAPAGGLLGLLQEAMRRREFQPNAGFDPHSQ